MLVDARTLPVDEILTADVCIVGGGPAGITVARELAASELRVLLVDRGGRAPARGPVGESVGAPAVLPQRATASAFGGTSHEWSVEGEAGLWHDVPLDRLDFDRRPGIALSGWPFSRDELVPYYQRATPVVNAPRFVYSADPESDEDAAEHVPVDPRTLVSTFLHVSDSAFAPYLDDLAAATRVTVVLHGAVVAIATDDDASCAIGADCRSSPDRRFSVRSRVTVIAAGGVGNARLLLLSNQVRPSGLGNAHDHVGRFLMDHLTVRSGTVVPADARLLGASRLYAPRVDEDGRAVVPLLRLHEDIVRRESLLSVACFADARPSFAAAGGVRSLSSLRRWRSVRPRPPFLARHARNVLADLPDVIRTRGAGAGSSRERKVLLLRIQAEQEPNPHSRVTLGDKRDANGQRSPRLVWRISDLDRWSIRRTQQVLGAELSRAGLGSVCDLLGDETPPALIDGIHHHLGTTRMDTDPKRGVVDGDGMVHGIRGLYVTGGSIFPTAGWANPTFTIIALAIRLADRLRHTLGVS